MRGLRSCDSHIPLPPSSHPLHQKPSLEPFLMESPPPTPPPLHWLPPQDYPSSPPLPAASGESPEAQILALEEWEELRRKGADGGWLVDPQMVRGWAPGRSRSCTFSVHLSLFTDFLPTTLILPPFLPCLLGTPTHQPPILSGLVGRRWRSERLQAAARSAP